MSESHVGRPSVPAVALADGRGIPQLGLGTWPMNDDEAERAVTTALELGYRHVDTASRYGNESGVGRGLRSSGIPRSAVFVTTKLRGSDHGRDAARTGLERSLARLGLEHVDLYLIHWPLPELDLYRDCWQTLLELRDAGLVGSAGVSNFTASRVEELIRDTGERPALNQIQCSPELPRTVERSEMARLGVPVASWRPLGSRDLHGEPAVQRIAARRGWTTAQVLLRWHVQQGLVATPKSSQPDRLRSNLDVFDGTLTADELGQIGSLPQQSDQPIDVDRYVEY